ncbi:hypothetical protein ACWEG1_06035 [Streptomyces bauhiniae]
MSRNTERLIPRWVRDGAFFQACAYSFAFTLATVSLVVFPIVLGAKR